MQTFRAGFDRTIITPPNGTPMYGYFFDRFSQGVLDDLEVNTLAVSDGANTALILCADLCHIPQSRADSYRQAIAEKCGLAAEAVYICCTHTHTGPTVGKGEEYLSQWERTLPEYLVSSAQRAMEDFAPAWLHIGRGRVERISFIRRYRMKDGGVRTNPGANNPDIVQPIGTPDETLQVVRLLRQDKPEIVLAHFQVHPDVIGGSRISADYPRFVRQSVEGALQNKARCIYFNGAQGDLNHVNTAPLPGESNGLEATSFDDCLRGYAFAQNMGRVIAGETLKVYGRCTPAAAVPVRFGQKNIRVASNKPQPEQLPQAQHIAALHNAGHDDQLPYAAMELTTAVAEALRMVALKDGPDDFELHLTAVALGDVAFLGIPGEPFTQIGRRIKADSPFAMTLPCCLANGSEGYFPMQDAYDEGGYEARSSFYHSGVAEAIIAAAGQLLGALKTQA